MTDPHEWLCAQARVSLSSREPKPLGHLLKATPRLSWGRTQTHVTVRATTRTQTTHFRFWAVGHVWYWTSDTTHRNQKLMQRGVLPRGGPHPTSCQQWPWYINLFSALHLLNCDIWGLGWTQYRTHCSLCPCFLGASVISSKYLFHPVLLIRACE